MKPLNTARPTLKDFAGRDFTLSDHPENWEEITPDTRKDILLLGLGPGNAARLPFVETALARGGRVFWLEHPDTLARLSLFPNFVSPADRPGWQRVMDPGHAGNARIFFYRPGLRAAPDFWQKILAKQSLKGWNLSRRKRGIWLPGDDRRLLRQELSHACQSLGYGVDCRVPHNHEDLPRLWSEGAPAAAISVNFRGLDSAGRIFYLLAEAGIQTAIWLVDNPWNLLSGIKMPWWRKARLFVTDASFIADLKKAGAENVRHLPLAVAPHMWAEGGGNAAPLFVGRSVFPAKESFFRGIRVPQGLREKAETVFASGGLPDCHWWEKHCAGPLWPGSGQRLASLGADDFSALNRARWISAALPARLRVLGDAGWHKYLPGAEILPPVDYYGSLRDFYGGAACVLNVTSLLLPASLSQRHFDVWAAGGLLLSDNTAGLEIFPGELTRPITLEKPEDFPERVAWHRERSAARKELVGEWRELLRGAHRYEHRVKVLLGENAG